MESFFCIRISDSNQNSHFDKYCIAKTASMPLNIMRRPKRLCSRKIFLRRDKTNKPREIEREGGCGDSAGQALCTMQIHRRKGVLYSMRDQPRRDGEDRMRFGDCGVKQLERSSFTASCC